MSEPTAIEADAWIQERLEHYRRQQELKDYAVRIGGLIGVPHEYAVVWTADDLRWIERQIMLTLEGR
jgi:hypothetical protein